MARGCAGHSDAVLRALCFPGPPVGIDCLVEETGLPRKKLINALGRLINAKLAVRILPPVRRFGPCISEYCATDAGRALIASGKRVTSGPKGALTRQRNAPKDTFRGRLWRALRMARKATIPDLVEIAQSGKERDAYNNANAYLRRLVLAGVAVELPTRAKGFAPTSPGFNRYALIRDLGPQAPIATATHVFDPNSGTRIPYREKV